MRDLRARQQFGGRVSPAAPDGRCQALRRWEPSISVWEALLRGELSVSFCVISVFLLHLYFFSPKRIQWDILFLD